MIMVMMMHGTSVSFPRCSQGKSCTLSSSPNRLALLQVHTTSTKGWVSKHAVGRVEPDYVPLNLT